MIESEGVKHGGVQIVDVHLVLGHLVSKLIGGTVNLSAFNASAGHPCAERFAVVVSTGFAPSALVVTRGAAEFSAPDH